MTAVEVRTGTAAALHARPLEPDSATVERLVVTAPTLVLGSTQPETHVDHGATEDAGVAVARRRSGGGAVLLEPERHVWVDLTIGRADPRWRDDVAAAFGWVGEAWVAALDAVGVDGTTVHRGPLRSSRWSRTLCFAGIGPGEVLAPDGRKLVGLSQRRTRDAARFQCLVLLEWEPQALVALLALDDAARAEAATALAAAAAAVGVPGDQLVAALASAVAG